MAALGSSVAARAASEEEKEGRLPCQPSPPVQDLSAAETATRRVEKRERDRKRRSANQLEFTPQDELIFTCFFSLSLVVALTKRPEKSCRTQAKQQQQQQQQQHDEQQKMQDEAFQSNRSVFLGLSDPSDR
ncbi:uncharacterized protein V6R79_000644 [Siganus canaliculatus]